MNRALEFFGRVWRLTDGNVGLTLLFSLLASLTEGISLALLIPILALIEGSNAASSQVPVLGKVISDLNLGLAEILGVFVALIVVQALIARASSLFSMKTLLGASDRLRVEFFNSVGRARWDVIQERRVSDLNLILNGEIGRVQMAIGNMLSFLQSIILLAIYFALALFVSWQMALFAVGIGVVLFAMLYPLRRKAGVFGEEMSGLYGLQQATLLEFLTGLRVAKSFGAEDRYAGRYWQRMMDIRAKTIQFARLTAWGALVSKAFSAAAAALFILVAVEVIQIDVGRLLVLLVILLRIAPRFQALQDAAQNFLNNLAAYRKVRSAMDELQDAAEPPAILTRSIPPLQSEIRFEGLAFAYPAADAAALRGIDLTIEAGEITALIGPSGSGKSTLADLAMALLHPTEGSILIDSSPLEDGNRRSWREQVAFVPQEAILFNDTIAANLRIAAPEASDADLWIALERANARGFVESLANGLETPVGERGTRFSGGERQRLTLARALLRQPRLLILDEATSALDWQNQERIAADIARMRGELTILMIAHRPSMVAFADKVAVLEHGRITACGRYADLAADPTSQVARMIRGEKSPAGGNTGGGPA